MEEKEKDDLETWRDAELTAGHCSSKWIRHVEVEPLYTTLAILKLERERED